MLIMQKARRAWNVNTPRTNPTLMENLNGVSVLGVPRKYDFSKEHTVFIIPVVYGVMHLCHMVFFCILPLTMMRATLTKMKDIPYYGEKFGRDDWYAFHRMIGYSLLASVISAGCIWWVSIYESCTDGLLVSCNALYPSGSYIDIRGPPWYCTDEGLDQADDARGRETDFRKITGNSHCVVSDDGNTDAVMFLREIVIVTFVCIAITAEFKYPLFKLFKVKGRKLEDLQLGSNMFAQFRHWKNSIMQQFGRTK